MSSEFTPNLRLPYLAAAQSQKHVTHNEAIRALDAVVQLSVLTQALASPPATPLNGQRWIVAAAATGAWSGQSDAIAAFQDGAWTFLAPVEGWLAWVADVGKLVAWTDAGWADAGGAAPDVSINPAPLVGVNATADATNRLAVKSPASLFDNAGNGHQIKINKATVSDTASVLYQDAYSGRAEIGLCGDDNFHFKVSADGVSWKNSIVVDAATGAVSMPFTPPVGSSYTLPPASATTLGGVKQGSNVAIATDGTVSVPASAFDAAGAASAAVASLPAVARSGNYADLANKPTLGSAAALNAGSGAGNAVQLTPAGNLPVVDGSQLTNVGGAVNTVFGPGAGSAVTSATGIVAIGQNAAHALTTQPHAIAIGTNALAAFVVSNPAQDPNNSGLNIAIGKDALASTTDTFGNIAIGKNTLKSVTTVAGVVLSSTFLDANFNVAIGDGAGAAITRGSENNLLGNNAGLSITTGYQNTAIGTEPLKFCTTGNFNAAFGGSAIQSVTTGSSNTGLGESAGTSSIHIAGIGPTVGSYNTFVGSQTTQTDNNGGADYNYMTVVGGEAQGGQSNAVYLGRLQDVTIVGGVYVPGSSTVKVAGTAALTVGAGNTARAFLKFEGTNAPPVPAVGEMWWNSGTLSFRGTVSNHILNATTFYTSPTTNGFTGGSNIWIGRLVGNTTLAPATANGQAASNTAIGNGVGQGLTTGIANTLAGQSVGNAITSGNTNTAFGANLATLLATGGQNTLVGHSLLTAGGAGAATQNTIVGYNCGNAITSGGPNVLIGVNIGNAITNAYGNVCLGSSTANSLTGSNNVVIGYNLGGASLTSGANNTIVGGGYALPANVSNTFYAIAGNVPLIIADATSVRPQKPIIAPGYTVATLPAASAALKGARAHVTDATAPSWLGALTGGGAVACPVFCNGTAWVAG